MPELFFPFTLRVYTHTLHCLGNHNFTGLDLFYRIKDCWKGRDVSGPCSPPGGRWRRSFATEGVHRAGHRP
jgi:hypothetical protein